MPEQPMNEQYVLQNGRPTIAVLAGSMVSPYQESILRGVAHVAAKQDYNVIGFSGGAVNSADILSLAREKVFELVDMNFIAGIISPFSSLMRFLDEPQSLAFVERFSSVPIVNIGSHISGYTNVQTDYEEGYRQLFEHFKQVHDYHHIVLMRGPEFHDSSNKREVIFKALLAQYQLPYDDRAIICSDLNRRSAKEDIERFFDASTQPIDAILAINDSQALGIIDACKERGFRVPEDIAVIGAMDTLEGAFTTPPLSSIQEPSFELGRAAAIELIAQIEGSVATAEILLPTSLVVRQSCGCSNKVLKKEINHVKERNNQIIAGGDDDPVFKDTQSVFQQIVEQYKGGIIKEEVFKVLSDYQLAICKKDFTAFLTTLQNILESALQTEDIALWLAVITKLELSTLRYLALEPEAYSFMTFVEQLINMKNDIEQTVIKFHQFESEYHLNYFRSIVNNLNTSFDLTRIKKYTTDTLQLSEFYISLFDKENAGMATNSVAVHERKLIELENKYFIAKKLIPDDIVNYQERFTLVVFPLSFRRKFLGFLTVNFSNQKGYAFENLRAIISSSLKNEMLIQDLQSAEERFSDIAHSTSNWLWETDSNNQFTYCSNSSKDIIGYSPEMLLGQNIDAFKFTQESSYLQRMSRHEDLSEIECWYRHQDDSVICLLISAKPIKKEGVFSGYRGVFEDITEQKLQADKISTLAYSDILTGLPNRTFFQEKLEDVITISSTQHKKFALMFIDLDHFKHVNDSMGHAGGDLLLIKLAKRINNSIRAQDSLARLGGDEFVIILPDIEDEKQVGEIAERIFTDIKEAVIVHDKPVFSKLSLGISLFPNDGVDAQSLLQKGDNAMYQAKAQGRNGYVFYNKLLEQKHILRNMYEGILREALATDGFILYYQPQVSVHTKQIVGFEVLVRINDPKLGIISPNNFISLAEELGLIDQVDEWVFKNACKQYAQWQEKGLKDICLSVNLSAVQLRNDSVLKTYIEILEMYQISPSDIQLEITENALIENEHIALKVIQGFKNHGMSVAIDDFGTGYSSLHSINLYPIDTIKIDRSFVIDALDNPRNKAIIQGVVLISRSLGLDIIAEGVETKAQCTLMEELGCHTIQGYYFYKPRLAEDVFAVVQKKSMAVVE